MKLKKLLPLILLSLCLLTSVGFSMGETIREPYQENSKNVELYGELKYKMREKIKWHQEKISKTRELKNIIPDRQYKSIINEHQKAINELERYANRDIEYYYNYAYKLPKQEDYEGYSNAGFTQFMQERIKDLDQEQ